MGVRSSFAEGSLVEYVNMTREQLRHKTLAEDMSCTVVTGY